jgi:hypothetical protein
MPRETRKAQKPEDQLRDLQETFESVEDLQNLSQPNLAVERDGQRQYVIETYTTYGAYEDPI